MKTEIAKLIQLAKIDAEIDVLAEQRDEIPQTIHLLEQEIEIFNVSLNSKKNELGQMEMEKRQKELELTEKREWVNARQEKLKEIKTNKEYHAALKEIELTTKATTKLEEDIQTLQAKIEAASPLISTVDDEAQQKRTNLEKEIGEKRAVFEGLDQQISEKIALRNQQEQEVSKDLLKRYKVIKDRLNPAMALASEGTCQECYTRIPPQLYIELQKFSQVINCPRCHRILHTELIAD